MICRWLNQAFCAISNRIVFSLKSALHFQPRNPTSATSRNYWKRTSDTNLSKAPGRWYRVCWSRTFSRRCTTPCTRAKRRNIKSTACWGEDPITFTFRPKSSSGRGTLLITQASEVETHSSVVSNTGRVANSTVKLYIVQMYQHGQSIPVGLGLLEHIRMHKH